MPDDVFLKLIEFKTWGIKHEKVVSSVRCELSNGLSSPEFSNENYKHYQAKVVNFCGRNPVAGVQAYDNKLPQRITFLDNLDQEIDSFNPAH